MTNLTFGVIMLPVYTAIEKDGFEDGVIFITTTDNRLIELHLYAGLIINIKSRVLSADDALQLITEGKFTGMNMQAKAVSLDTTQPAIIEKTLAVVGDRPFAPQRVPESRLVHLLGLLAYLASSSQSDYAAISKKLTGRLESLYPDFSLDLITIKRRIRDLYTSNGIEIPELPAETAAHDHAAILNTVLNRVRLLWEDAVLATTIVYYIFFGRLIHQVHAAKVKKDDGFGAKAGSVKLSKAVYPQFPDKETVLVFHQSRKLGDMHIVSSPDKRPEVIFSKLDLDRFGLKEGDSVILLLPRTTEKHAEKQQEPSTDKTQAEAKPRPGEKYEYISGQD
jgi:hypothetical protein